ncbi:hypothetical protein [Steroidobacter agaridevorans]|uniref:hypothetical protein n=1 Tax=Steroidobacter agaridevorans TaxID=2695856 RepID=UPI00137B2C0E|nr:hypothetical protein [Steroidobacter agaridevorans]
MTEEKDKALEFTGLEDAVKLIDLGDAVEETRQLTPHGMWPDCQYGFGAKYGCS